MGSGQHLLCLRQHLDQAPLITMAFRFRRSTNLGPLRFNFAKSGLSSISVGGQGASFNIPVSRSGGPRTTVGLPSSCLSWSVEQTADRPAAMPVGAAAGLPISPRTMRSFSRACNETHPPQQRWGICADKNTPARLKI